MLNFGFVIGWLVGLGIAFLVAFIFDAGPAMDMLLGLVCTFLAFPCGLWYERHIEYHP